MAGFLGIFGGGSPAVAVEALPPSSCISFNDAVKIDYQGFEKILKQQKEQNKTVYLSLVGDDGPVVLEVTPKGSPLPPAPKPIEPPSGGKQCGCSGVVDVKLSCVKNGQAYGFLFRPVEIVSLKGIKSTKKDRFGRNVNYPRWDKGHDADTYKGEGLVRLVPSTVLGSACSTVSECTPRTTVDALGTTLEQACLNAGAAAAGKSLSGSANEVSSATIMERNLSQACDAFGGKLIINKISFNSNYPDYKNFTCGLPNGPRVK